MEPVQPADVWARLSALQQTVQQWLQQHESLVQEPLVVNTLPDLGDALTRHQVRPAEVAEWSRQPAQ